MKEIMNDWAKSVSFLLAGCLVLALSCCGCAKSWDVTDAKGNHYLLKEEAFLKGQSGRTERHVLDANGKETNTAIIEWWVLYRITTSLECEGFGTALFCARPGVTASVISHGVSVDAQGKKTTVRPGQIALIRGTAIVPGWYGEG